MRKIPRVCHSAITAVRYISQPKDLLHRSANPPRQRMAPGTHRRTYALVLETDSHTLTQKSKLNHRAAEHCLRLCQCRHNLYSMAAQRSGILSVACDVAYIVIRPVTEDGADPACRMLGPRMTSLPACHPHSTPHQPARSDAMNHAPAVQVKNTKNAAQSTEPQLSATLTYRMPILSQHLAKPVAADEAGFSLTPARWVALVIIGIVGAHGLAFQQP